MLYLKQSTASQSVLIGPFVDDTDGTTAETGLTIANTDIRLSANGGNLVAKNSGGATHDEAGWYTITLDATDTATVGRLQLHCKMSGALMVHHEFQVLEETIYDALFAASAAGELAVKLSTQGKADVNAEADTALSDYDPPTKAELDSGFAALNDPTAAAVADAVWDEATTGHTTAGTFGEQVKTDIDAILLDTAEIGAAGAGLTAVPWNSAWDAEVQSECTDALNAYDPPTKAETDAAALAALTTQMTESYAANGTAPTLAQAMFAVHQMLMQFSISGTSYTVKKLDNSTTAFVVTLDDATSPTGAART